MLRDNSTFSNTKPHYELLDGLRGVAALLVLLYHVFEGFAFAAATNGVGSGMITVLNHAYLAVDFFFLLSGFVIGYAYDDRWVHGFTLRDFIRRRLIRLHPMVVLSVVVGVVCYLLQGSTRWDGTSVALHVVMWATLLSLFMLPVRPGSPCDVRGNGEMFPLNGPMWSLFFEYIGNLVYALVVRRLGTRVLTVVVALLGLALVWFTAGDALGEGMFGVGWSLGNHGFVGGLVRMLFPYTLGMLMARRFRPVRVRWAFASASLVLAAIMIVPYIEPAGGVSLNGVFEAVCIILVFPTVLWLGASGRPSGRRGLALCRLLGDISYPLYVLHYPLYYLFYAWLIEHQIYSLSECLPQAVTVVVGSIFLAFLSMHFYDKPLRMWLTRKTR